MRINAYGAASADKPVSQMTIERREPGTHDVEIEIRYCGICHSDLHTVRGEWGGTQYPCVPGHEIVGRVAAVGSAVTAFKPGDIVGVGCLVDSCRHCHPCEEGLEQYCERGGVGTYNAPTEDAPGYTMGGYAERIVANDYFVLKISHDEKDLAAVAPLLCAGITTYSPLRHWHTGPGKKVGVVGLGGLGHMAVKLASAMGAEVVVFTSSESKRGDATALGAHQAVLSSDKGEMRAHRGTFDLILDTVSASHNLDTYVSLLRLDGTLCLLGAPELPHPSPNVTSLIAKRRAITGSIIGGIPETQEMLDFCAEHNIVADIELIPAQKIEAAYERMQRNDIKYRFVIDNATMKA